MHNPKNLLKGAVAISAFLAAHAALAITTSKSALAAATDNLRRAAAAEQPAAAPAPASASASQTSEPVEHFRITTNGIFYEQQSDGSERFGLQSLQDAGDQADDSTDDGIADNRTSNEGVLNTQSKLGDQSGHQGLQTTPKHQKKGKTYTVNGKRYEPFSDIDTFTQKGISSWYGSEFKGRKTASGETFDPSQLTAAHKELPLGSVVKVSYPATGKSVVVRITDRGPFHGNRILDLSYAAAKKIGLVKHGKGKVKIELISEDGKASKRGKSIQKKTTL